MAGPGQKPTTPQPIPKISAPKISLPSIGDIEGAGNVPPNRGFGSVITSGNPTAATPTAPNMTKARLGSQSPVKSRNASTFAGSTIWETQRPKPNRAPEKTTKIILVIDQSYNMWRSTKTVITPVNIKLMVAANDRKERLASPHTP